MRRALIIGLVLLACLVAAGVSWLRTDGETLVEVSRDEIEAARESGAGARTVEVESVPTFEDLKAIGRRADLDQVALRVDDLRFAATNPDERAMLGVLASEIARLRGDVETCHRLALEAAEALPDNSRAHHALAKAILARIAEESRGGGASALGAAVTSIKPYLAEVRTAIELDPANVDARVSEIIVLAYAPWPVGNKKRARALVEEIGAYDELRRDFWRAQLVLAEGDKALDEALAVHEELIVQYPHDLDVQISLGEIHLKRGEYQRAAELFDPLAQRDADSPWTVRARYLGAKAREGGKFELERALQLLDEVKAADPVGDLVPQPDRIAYHEGCVLRRLDRLDEAKRALLRALDVGPQRDDVTREFELVERALSDR